MNPDDPLGLIGAKPQASADDPLGLKSSAPRIPTKLEIAKRNASMPHPEDTEDAEPSYAEKALGGIAAFGHDIPGVEAMQAGARSFFRAHPSGPKNRLGFVPTAPDESYSDALGDVKSAEDAAPKGVRMLNNATGATIAALAGPKGTYMDPLGKGGSAFVQGARLGAATGLASAEPASIQDRLLKAGKGGAVGGTIAGILGDVAPNVARVIAAKSLGANALQRGAQMTVADEGAYGKALAEGQGVADPDVTAVLDSPGIKGYANAARKAPSLAGADDATILHETYKRLGERQRGLEAQIERAASYKAGPAREVQDIELMKQKLLDAADKIMPSYRQAVQQHAELAGQSEAFEDASDATRRIVNKTSVAGRNLDKNTPEAFKARIIAMDKEKAQAAREAVLGRLQEKAGDALNKNPLKVFGSIKALGTVNKLAPYLDMIDQQVGGPTTGYLRKALAAGIGTQAGN